MGMHSHNDAQHQNLANKASEIKGIIDDLYVNHHNGDAKLNKRIMNLKDTFLEFNALFQEHINDTVDFDDKYEEGQRALRLIKNVKMVLFGVIGTAAVTVILERIFDML